MFDEYWNNFVSTGSVNDYLKYKQNQNNKETELTNANDNKGIDNKRTDHWGE
jgi:hypothetical protein